MFKNFFKVVMRSLWRYKGYALVNIIGMGIGIAAMVWGFVEYQYSFSYDKFHKDVDNVYRAVAYKQDADGMQGIFPMAVADQLQKDFSGITETVRLDSRGMNMKYDKSDAFSETVHFTDPSFFSLFNFPLVKGNNNLNDRNAILITESMAKKYFGNDDPLGKPLTLYAGETYALPLTVSGIVKDMPYTSTIQFKFLTHFDNQLKFDGTKILPGDWKWFLDAAFFKIPDAANANRLKKEMDKYIPLQNKARDDWKVGGFNLVTLRQSALYSHVIRANNLYERPDDSAAYGPFVLAILIFISSCLNFSNTTVARANTRLKEIGMRKVMGGTHAQLIRQLLMECGVIVLVAILLSILFNMWWLPAFNNMFGDIKLQADYLHNSGLQLFILFTLLLTTLIAGAYPAFYISRFNPTAIFRGTVKFGGSNLFSRIMLGLQISIAIITVIAGVGFARNAEYQKNYDFGYNLQNTMGISFFDSTSYTALRNEMAAVKEVKAMAGTRHHIGFGYRNVTAESQGVKKETNYLEVGREYLKTMDLKMVAGRSFDVNRESDYTDALLISQRLAAMYGWKEEEALGKQIHIDSTNFTVAGILKDFHADNFFDPLEPVAMRLCRDNRFQYLIIKAEPKDLTTVYMKAKDAWKKVFPLKPFSGFYQNDITAEGYKNTVNIAKIFAGFAVVCILLTATGLFALVSLTTLKKMKEIALRKVSGAAPRHIAVLINKSYFWIFIAAAALGAYGGWSLTTLLMGMIFKINSGVGFSSVTWSVMTVFLIAAFVSGIKVWQAVRTNPVKMLRTE